MLANNGKIVADDGSKVTFTTSGNLAGYGIPIANTVTYNYNDGATHYQVLYNNPAVIADEPFGAGAYLRFLGTVTLKNGAKVEKPSNSPASWELMWLPKIS
jgi:hypothetical protein